MGSKRWFSVYRLYLLIACLVVGGFASFMAWTNHSKLKEQISKPEVKSPLVISRDQTGKKPSSKTAAQRNFESLSAAIQSNLVQQTEIPKRPMVMVTPIGNDYALLGPQYDTVYILYKLPGPDHVPPLKGAEWIIKKIVESKVEFRRIMIFGDHRSESNRNRTGVLFEVKQSEIPADLATLRSIDFLELGVTFGDCLKRLKRKSE